MVLRKWKGGTWLGSICQVMNDCDSEQVRPFKRHECKEDSKQCM